MPDSEIIRKLQKENLLRLVKHGEPKFTDKWFPYTSGEVGPYYIQSVVVEKNGQDYRDAIDSIANLIILTVGDEFDAISGGETRDWDFSNPVAYALGKPHVKLYKDAKPLGAEMKDKQIVHVADLQNEGSSIRDLWHPQITNNGGKLVHALFYVDRLEHGVEVMKDLNIPSHAVVPLDANAWQILLDINYITPELYTSLNKRMEDSTAWAHNALKTHPGELEKMLRSENQKERAKGEKILNTYKEIRQDLLDILKARGYVHGKE